MLLAQSAVDLSGQGPLVAALGTAIAVLAGVVVILWKQNQRLYREMADHLRAARDEAVQRENRVHQTVDKVGDLLDALPALLRQTLPPKL